MEVCQNSECAHDVSTHYSRPIFDERDGIVYERWCLATLDEGGLCGCMNFESEPEVKPESKLDVLRTLNTPEGVQYFLNDTRVRPNSINIMQYPDGGKFVVMILDVEVVE